MSEWTPAQISRMRAALERMVYWFGNYPWMIPAPDIVAKYEKDIRDAKAILDETRPDSERAQP